MTQTLIQVTAEQKKQLDNLKEYPRETYSDTVEKLLYPTKNEITNK